MPKLLLIRHGQSENNARPEHLRVCDPGLTELGERQSAVTADALADAAITHLYCSPFLRSLETIRPLAERTELRVSVRSDLFERGGCYSGHEPGKKVGEPGMTRLELETKYPGWELDSRIEPAGWWGKAFETESQVLSRAGNVARWLSTDIASVDGLHAMVIHADFKRLLIAALLGDPMRQLMPTLGPMHNTGVSAFEWSNEAWRLLSLNATTHLPADHVT